MGILKFRLPLDEYDRINDPYKMRYDPVKKRREERTMVKINGVKTRNPFGTPYKLHAGIDYKVEKRGVDITEAKVLASERGIVVRASFHPALGETIIIDHTPNAKAGLRQNYYYTLYEHLKLGDAYKVRVGNKVKRGEQIGNYGNSGTASTGRHLHFSIVESGIKLGWNATGSTGVDPTPSTFKNPLLFYNKDITVNGTIDDKEVGEFNADLLERLKDRLDAKPFFDQDGNITHADIYLADKRLGTVNPGSDSFEIELLKEDLKKLLYRSRPNPGNPQVKLEVEVSTT